jgi:DNA-binding GntR family transcriptional regulator
MPLPDAGPIQSRENAGDAVYDRLRHWILEGPLEPGEIIRDAQIARALGVSRTPVREALLRLQAEGLIETSPARWTRVAPLKLDQAGNLYAVGAALDALAAEQATPRLTEAHFVEMQRANDRCRQTTDPTELQAADEAFHGAYYRAAANPIIETILDNVLFEIRRLERVNFRDPGTREVAFREHSAIIDAFRSGDARLAAEAARTNWLNAWPRVAEMLAARNGHTAALRV